MATPKIIADFETQLASAIAVGSTSFTLASATDDDGVAIPAGKYYFTVDNASTQKEYLVGTVSGTAVTSVSNVSRQGVETSGCLKAHRIGASVIMTDFMTYKNYIDEIALASAPDASNTAKGVVETATLAQVRARTAIGETGAALVVTPDVMDDLPTSDQKAALAGTAGTPSSSNKYVTQDGLTPTIQTFLSSGTYTKPSGVKQIFVQAWGGGASGASYTGQNAAGGGGGSYFERWINAADVGATETVTIGNGGAAVSGISVGNAGQSTTFGLLVTAFGGAVGTSGVGATTGGNGGDIQAGSTLFRGLGVSAAVGGIGILWGGAAGGGVTDATTGHAGGSALYGGGGGGGSCVETANSHGAGGASIYGGSGGAAGATTATAGSVPGGGGGGSGNGTSGAGGKGKIVVTEYYS